MTNIEGREILAELRKEFGRGYKAMIRQAWMDGNYAGAGLGHWSNKLQNMRNILGPTWLQNATPMEPDKDRDGAMGMCSELGID
jgi:hypothetical protein